MPRELSLTSKYKLWAFKRRIKTPEQKEMILEEAKKELANRRNYFERNKNNFNFFETDSKGIFYLFDSETKKPIVIVKIKKINSEIYFGDELNTGIKSKEKQIKYRDLGFARALLTKVIEHLKKQGAKKLIFNCRPDLIKFYENLGAKRIKKTFKQTLNDMAARHTSTSLDEFNTISPLIQMVFEIK